MGGETVLFGFTAAQMALLGEVIMINFVLSGDNAVVIALACRNLSPEQRRKGIFWGVAGAIGLRVVLTAFAAVVMNLPWLKAVGSPAAAVDRRQIDAAAGG